MVLQWRQTTPEGLIHSNEVHVWRVRLDLTSFQLESLTELLSADELARAGRLRFEKDQKRFVAARGILRKILSCYLGTNPLDIRFEYTSYGKPVLARNSGYDKLNFNLSHSDACALYAVTRGQNIGIDIERIRNDIAIEQIARRFFSPREITSLMQIQDSRRPEVFFQYWTRKEAFLKATGAGLSLPMEQCDVSSMTGAALAPITLFQKPMESSCGWYGQDLFPVPGFAAAIAVEGLDWNLSYWDYLHESCSALK